MKPKSKVDIRISIKMNGGLIKKLEQRMKDDDNSASAIIRLALKKYLETKAE